MNSPSRLFLGLSRLSAIHDPEAVLPCLSEADQVPCHPFPFFLAVHVPFRIVLPRSSLSVQDPCITLGSPGEA